LRKYETVFILDPALDSSTTDQEIKKVEDLIASREGKVLKVDRWGSRRLAYPIAKKQQGYYTLILFEGEGDLINELERNYRLNESCLRYLTVVSEEKIMAEKPSLQEKDKEDKEDKEEKEKE